LVSQDPSDISALLDESAFAAGFPKALAWFRSHKEWLKSRSAPNKSWRMDGADWYRLQGSFEYMDGPYLVVVPEQKMPSAAAIVGKQYDSLLGRQVVPLANHKVVFCAVGALDVALYLCAILNGTLFGDLIQSFSSSTAVSPTVMARLPIPLFEAGNEKISKLVDIARVIYRAPDRRAEWMERKPGVDRLVAELMTEAGQTAEVVQRRVPSRGRRLRESDTAQIQFPIEGLTIPAELNEY